MVAQIQRVRAWARRSRLGLDVPALGTHLGCEAGDQRGAFVLRQVGNVEDGVVAAPVLIAAQGLEHVTAVGGRGQQALVQGGGRVALWPVAQHRVNNVQRQLQHLGPQRGLEVRAGAALRLHGLPSARNEEEQRRRQRDVVVELGQNLLAEVVAHAVLQVAQLDVQRRLDGPQDGP